MTNSCVTNRVNTHMIVKCLASLMNNCRQIKKEKKIFYFILYTHTYISKQQATYKSSLTELNKLVRRWESKF